MVRTFTRIVLCLAVLAFAMTALAATKDGVVTINGGRQTIQMHPQANIHSTVRQAPALKTIYSNLGTGTDLFYCCEGWTISGSGGAVGGDDWIATPFTPTKAATIKEIDVAVGYVEGTNEIVFTLTGDTGGLPGKTIHSWHYKNMPTFGSTYTTLDTVKSKKGIKVKAKKQYWVTVTTDTTDGDLWGAWNFDPAFSTGPFAYQSNMGGWQATNSDLGAFDVLGK